MYIDSSEYGRKEIFVVTDNFRISPELMNEFKTHGVKLRELLSQSVPLPEPNGLGKKLNKLDKEIVVSETDVLITLKFATFDPSKVGILLIPSRNELIICDSTGILNCALQLPCKVKSMTPMLSYHSDALELRLEREI